MNITKSDEIERNLRIFQQNRDLLIEACLSRNGFINVSEIDPARYESLSKARLINKNSHRPGIVSVHRKVEDFIIHCERGGSRRISVGEIRDMLNDIQGEVDQLEKFQEKYRAARKASGASSNEEDALARDYRSIVGKIEKGIHDLVGSVEDIITRFRHYLSDDFVSVTDTEYRMEENKKAIEKAQELRSIFTIIDMQYIDDYLSRIDDQDLNQVFMFLYSSIRSYDASLIECLKVLQDNFYRINNLSDRKKIKNVNAFCAFLSDYPTYKPDYEYLLTGIDEAPAFLSMAKPINIVSYPDVFHPLQSQAVATYAEDMIEFLIEKQKKSDIREQEKINRDSTEKAIEANSVIEEEETPIHRIGSYLIGSVIPRFIERNPASELYLSKIYKILIDKGQEGDHEVDGDFPDFDSIKDFLISSYASGDVWPDSAAVAIGSRSHPQVPDVIQATDIKFVHRKMTGGIVLSVDEIASVKHQENSSSEYP